VVPRKLGCRQPGTRFAWLYVGSLKYCQNFSRSSWVAVALARRCDSSTPAYAAMCEVYPKGYVRRQASLSWGLRIAPFPLLSAHWRMQTPMERRPDFSVRRRFLHRFLPKQGSGCGTSDVPYLAGNCPGEYHTFPCQNQTSRLALYSTLRFSSVWTPTMLQLVALRCCRSLPLRVAPLVFSDHRQEFSQTCGLQDLPTLLARRPSRRTRM